MSNEIACLYELAQISFNFEAFMSSFATKGMWLYNPQTSYIHALTEEGGTVFVSQDWIQAQIDAQSDVTFKLWFDDIADVVCVFRFSENLRVQQYYYLDSVPDASKDSWAIALLTERFKEGVQQGSAIGFLVDPVGRTEDVDWDEFMRGEGAAMSILPEILGIKRQAMGRITADRSTFTIEYIGEYVILRAPYIGRESHGALSDHSLHDIRNA